MDTTQTIVSSDALITLQADLKNLSSKLNDCYDVLQSSLSDLSQDWRDEKFDDFDKEFRSSKEKIFQISESYSKWADDYLQKRIDVVKEAEKKSMSTK